MNTPLLEFSDTTVDYRTDRGWVPAVRGVNLSLGPGETLGLAGESGCGKSTLAMTVLRLLPKTARLGGRVLLRGEDIADMTWGRLRVVRWAGAAVVFQGAMHALNPVRRIGEQVAEPIRLHNTVSGSQVQGRVIELLGQVGLPARRADAYPHELSGGQRQRVMIAMALACDPELLIADEPTTALDVMVQAQVLDLLAGLVAERGVGMMMISHDLSVLASSCQRLAVMYAGRIVEHGPAAQLVRDPRHPYTRALAGAFPTIGDPASRLAPTGLPGDPPDPASPPSGCSFHPRCPVVMPECSSTPVSLWPAGEDREAACLLVEGARTEAAQEVSS